MKLNNLYQSPFTSVGGRSGQAALLELGGVIANGGVISRFQRSEGISLLAICRDSRAYSVSLLSQRKGGVAIRAYDGFGQPGNDFGQVPFFNQARDGNDQVEVTTVRIQKRAPS